jgi:hypothetical protein
MVNVCLLSDALSCKSRVTRSVVYCISFVPFPNQTPAFREPLKHLVKYMYIWVSLRVYN